MRYVGGALVVGECANRTICRLHSSFRCWAPFRMRCRTFWEGELFPSPIRLTVLKCVASLLCNYKERIGRHSFQEILDHPFLLGVNWDNLEHGKKGNPVLPNHRLIPLSQSNPTQASTSQTSSTQTPAS